LTVAFLRRPSSYPDAPNAVVAIETHMSWVFLADDFAYKLKKPIRYDSLDLSEPDLRRRNCQQEVLLNRRLAPDVYLGVSAITCAPGGTLAFDGQGEQIDWVIRMRRLPADRMLDAIITSGRATGEERDIRTVAVYLARFLSAARPVPMSGSDYRARLEQGVREDAQALSAPRYRLSRGRLEALARAQLALLERRPLLFDERVQAGRIIEGHGDLRPEHICVRSDPAIIDCLEFSKDLRVLDAADELAFLALECERLGDPRVGRWFLDVYRDVSGDEPPPPLLHFYRVYRALRRAKIAAWHLDDPTVRDPERFAAKARHYLDLVEPVALDGIGPRT
jgi:aminoglycoside phosphotransferase family enzyme